MFDVTLFTYACICLCFMHNSELMRHCLIKVDIDKPIRNNVDRRLTWLRCSVELRTIVYFCQFLGPK